MTECFLPTCWPFPEWLVSSSFPGVSFPRSNNYLDSLEGRTIAFTSCERGRAISKFLWWIQIVSTIGEFLCQKTFCPVPWFCKIYVLRTEIESPFLGFLDQWGRPSGQVTPVLCMICFKLVKFPFFSLWLKLYWKYLQYFFSHTMNHLHFCFSFRYNTFSSSSIHVIKLHSATPPPRKNVLFQGPSSLGLYAEWLPP